MSGFDRFLRIKNNMIIQERFDSLNRMVDGEIVDDGTFGKVGQVFKNGTWQDENEIMDPDEVSLTLLQTEGVI